MSSHLRQALLSLTLLLLLLLLLGLAGVAEACCGTTPTHFFTVTQVGKIDCDAGRGTGAVQWQVSYHLPPGENMVVYSYGDGIIQGSDGYPDLPHAPGTLADVMSGTTVWQWEPGSSNPRKVRIEFWANYVTDNTLIEDRGLIVFDCTNRGATNIHIHNL